MEFDKSKILTVVTADKLNEGQMGWINDCVDYLKSDIKNINPYKVFRANENMPLDDFPFAAEGRGIRRYFYPAPEPTYAERQAQWVRDNGVKVDTKVRVTRSFTSYEGGCCTAFVPEKGTFVGDDCTVEAVGGLGIVVRSKQKNVWWSFPYFVLEVVPEESWFKIGDKVRITIKSSEAYNKIGTVTDTHVHRDGTQTVYLSFEEFRDTKAFNADSKEKIGELYTPTYAERQAEWVVKNNIKVGTKVRFTKGFKAAEDGSRCREHRDAKGMEGFVSSIEDEVLFVRMPSDGWAVPFTSLEVVKEPTYRPYNNDELNDLVGEVLTSKFSGRRKLVTGRPKQKTQVNLDGKPFTAEILLQYYYRNKTEPCGVKI